MWTFKKWNWPAARILWILGQEEEKHVQERCGPPVDTVLVLHIVNWWIPGYGVGCQTRCCSSSLHCYHCPRLINCAGFPRDGKRDEVKSFWIQDSGLCRGSFQVVRHHFNRAHEHGEFWIDVYDIKLNRWHDFRFSIVEEALETMSACGGGLMCFFSSSPNKEETPLYILVVNPLTTKDCRTLPQVPNNL